MSVRNDCPLWWVIQYNSTWEWRRPTRDLPVEHQIRRADPALDDGVVLATGMYDLESALVELVEAP